MREINVETKLIREGKSWGVWVIKSEGLLPGFPDRLLLATRGRFRFVELKRPGGEWRPAQRLVKHWLSRLGHRVYMIEHTDEVAPFYEKWLRFDNA